MERALTAERVAKRLGGVRVARALCIAALFGSATARAQGAPPTAGFPSGEPAPEAPAAPPQSGSPAAPPPPESGPPPVQYAPPQASSPPAVEAAPSEPADAEPPVYTPHAPPEPPPVEEPPLPPAPDEHHGFKMPPWSVRIDPFTWLIEGRLGVELEVGVLKWLSVEMVPVFVTNTTPPALGGFSGRDPGVEQHSNGLGPISGTSIGAGFWLDGHVLHGYVIRAIFTNYGYEYTNNLPDRFVHTERVLEGMFGSNATWGPFTISGGIGLGVDLNHQHRCAPVDPGCSDLELDTGNLQPPNVISSGIYPVVIDARFSLGVTFD